MEDNEPIDIVPMVQQRLMWDILPCDQVGQYWEAMKLVPPGPDVGEEAHAESHARMRRMAPLQPACEMYIVLTADIITAVMWSKLMERIDGEDPRVMEMAEDAHNNMRMQNREVVRGSLYSTLANLIDGGLLTINQPQVVA